MPIQVGCVRVRSVHECASSVVLAVVGVLFRFFTRTSPTSRVIESTTSRPSLQRRESSSRPGRRARCWRSTTPRPSSKAPCRPVRPRHGRYVLWDTIPRIMWRYRRRNDRKFIILRSLYIVPDDGRTVVQRACAMYLCTCRCKVYLSVCFQSAFA